MTAVPHVVGLRAMATTAAEPAFAPPGKWPHLFLRVSFDDGTEQLWTCESLTLEHFARSIDLWLPGPKRPLYAHAATHGEGCTACAACHHEELAPQAALSALGLRPSGIRQQLAVGTTEFALNGVFASIARATSWWRWSIAKILDPQDRVGAAHDALESLLEYVQAVQVYEVIVDPKLDQDVSKWKRARRLRRLAGS